MLGPAKPRHLDEPIAVSLEDLVPRDHFYRHLEATLDLSFVRDWTWELYAGRGRPSIDPVVFFRRKIRPHHVTGDAKYGTTENVVAIEDAGIRAYIPLPDFDHRTSFFGRDLFTYDPERDEYRCPEGQVLPRYRAKRTEAVVVYRAGAATCNACPVKPACTGGEHGRTIQRSDYAEYLEKVRSYHATEPYQKAMRKRKVWVEPLFAEAKMWHGLRRLRWRGLDNANIHGLLIAAGQNLKRFLAATGWGRRNAPCGSLLALPREPEQLTAVYGW